MAYRSNHQDENALEDRGKKVILIALSALILAMRPSTADDWLHFKQATQNLDGESTPVAVNGSASISTPTQDLWLPPAVNVSPRRRAPQADWDRLHRQLYCYSYPASPTLQGVLNPWGEQAPAFDGAMSDLPERILAACEVYRYQNVHFDGYLESTDDGEHLYLAADGLNVAVFGDNVNKRYRRVLQTMNDTLDERCWICVDLPIFALNLAGFPIRQAMVAHFLEDPELYTENWAFPDNVPTDQFFFRRVENLKKYMKAKQFYSEDTIDHARYYDPNYEPADAFRPGDVIFMGHYKAYDAKKPFEAAKHSGIVATVNSRGMPVHLYNMRTSNHLIDAYDGLVTQTRMIKGLPTYFHRFCDRYSIIGHGRIVRPAEWPDQQPPTIQMVNAFLEKRKQQLAEAAALAATEQETSATLDAAIAPSSGAGVSDGGTSISFTVY